MSGFFFVHLDQNSGRDKTQVLAETQVFLSKTQLFFSPKLRFPKLSKSLYYISFSKTQPEQRKTQVKIPKTQVSETFLIFHVSKKWTKKKPESPKRRRAKSLYFLVLL